MENSSTTHIRGNRFIKVVDLSKIFTFSENQQSFNANVDVVGLLPCYISPGLVKLSKLAFYLHVYFGTAHENAQII